MSYTYVQIDGIPYTSDYIMVTDIEQKGEILNGEKSGRAQTGDMFIEEIGTYYNYSMKIHRRSRMTNEMWDDLYTTLTDPHNAHTLTLPHNQGTLEQKMYISSCNRKLTGINENNGIVNSQTWGDYTVEFIAMSPQRRA